MSFAFLKTLFLSLFLLLCLGTAAQAQADPPAQVTGVTVTPGAEQLTVNWDAAWDRVTGADSYKVQWKSDSQGYGPDIRQNTIGDGATTTSTGLTGTVASEG